MKTENNNDMKNWKKALLMIMLIIIPTTLIIPTALAANDPGHDTVYIEQQGDSELNGTLNVTQNISISGGRTYQSSGLSIYGNGYTTAPAAEAYISGVTGSHLYLEGQGNIYLKYLSGGDTIYVGKSGITATDLNVSGAVYIQSTTAQVAGQDICLENGTNCPSALGGANITGSGSTNYVASWTGTSTLSTGILWQNSTNVGIGTTEPTEFLHIAGQQKGLRIQNTGTGGGDWLFYSTQDADGAGGGKLSIRKQGDVTANSKVVIDSSGNIGISMSSPTAKLHVNGSINVTSGNDFCIEGTGKCLSTTGTGSGTVTSVAMTVPTGLSISGTPITTSGTLALSLTSGYIIPTTTNITNLGTAYTHSQATTNVHGLTFTAEGSGGGLDADTLDGHDTTYFYAASNPSGYITDGNTGWDNSYGYITDDTSVPKNHLANSGTLGFTWADSEVSDTLTASSVPCSGVTGNGVGCSDIYLNTAGDSVSASGYVGLSGGTSYGIGVSASNRNTAIFDTVDSTGSDTLELNYYTGSDVRIGDGSGQHNLHVPSGSLSVGSDTDGTAGTVYATSFSGAGTGLTGTASSLTAGDVSCTNCLTDAEVASADYATSAGDAGTVDSIDSSRIVYGDGVYKVAHTGSTLSPQLASGFYESDDASDGPEAAGWTHYIINTHSNSGAGNGYQLILAQPYWSDTLYARRVNADTKQPWRKIWDNGNDGSGSGLDADTLDGVSSASFYLASNPSGYITDGNTNWDNSYGYITDGNTGWDNSYGYITDDTSVPKNHLANSGTLGFTWADSEVSDTLTASSVPWSGVSSKPSYIFYYQGFTLDANTMGPNAAGFSYSVNAPWTGPIASFSEGGYPLQLSATYSGGGEQLSFRTRNGDTATWNGWNTIWNSDNDGSGSGLDADTLDGTQPGSLSVNYANTAGSAPANGGTSTYSTYLWSTSHGGSYYISNAWDGTYWYITSNHGSPVRVGYADSAGAVAWSGVSSKPAFAANAVSERVRMYEVGCAGSWASSCDANTNGYADYADSAGSITSQGSLATQSSVTDAQVPDTITINNAGYATTAGTAGAVSADPLYLTGDIFLNNAGHNDDVRIQMYNYGYGWRALYWDNTNGRFSSQGSFYVGGTLSKAGGTFLIDHPLDPENKELRHSLVESPEMINIYKGRGKIINNTFTHKFPEWFIALNGNNTNDYEYSLTCLNGYSNLWIDKEINNNGEFVVGGEKEGQEFSFIVYAVRHDPYAIDNPVIVEKEKSEADKGKYYYPQGYGKNETFKIGYKEPNQSGVNN